MKILKQKRRVTALPPMEPPVNIEPVVRMEPQQNILPPISVATNQRPNAYAREHDRLWSLMTDAYAHPESRECMLPQSHSHTTFTPNYQTHSQQPVEFNYQKQQDVLLSTPYTAPAPPPPPAPISTVEFSFHNNEYPDYKRNNSNTVI